MSDFTESYKSLIILQYADKPKARQDIETRAAEWQGIYDFARSFEVEFDLDTAWGDRLDKIGKIVGQDRIVERGYAKKYFGFAGNPNAKGFGQAKLFDIFRDTGYEKTELDDEQFRFFIRAKIAKNTVYARMSSQSGGPGLQETIDFLFKSKAFVVDNKDMTLSVFIDRSYDIDQLRIIKDEDLLPSPQGVGYKDFIQYTDGQSFGFSENPNAKGFDQGYFAQSVTI